MSVRRRSRRFDLADEDDDDALSNPEMGGQQADSDEENATRNASQNMEGDSPVRRQGTAADDDLDGPLRKRQRTGILKAPAREPEEERRYPEGAIIRIRLKNFITYDAVEFRPGPNLNMIIGPNGTGKSSLVCAIALGLAGRPDSLGRQKALQDFVKDGKEKASIEIELKHRGRGGNVVIKRLFRKGQKATSTWKINGEHASEKAVKEKMQSMGVQVDNLCSFLPQEKVSEFAQMSPPELLRETERAAGNTRLAEWHNQLIELRDEEKKFETSVTEEKKHLENLEKRNAVLERDVARFRERESVLHNIRLLEMKIPWVHYDHSRIEYLEAKAEKQRLQLEFAAVQQRYAPLREQLEQMQEELRQLTANVKRLTNEYQEKTVSRGGLKGKSEELQAAEADSDELHKKLAGIQRREKEKIKKLQSLRTDIANGQLALEKLQAQLIETGLLSEDGESEGTGGELAELQSGIEAKNRDLREINDRVTALMQDQQEITDEAARYRHQREQRYNELNGLDNVRNQKLDILKREERHCWDATMWLKDNMHRFQHKVFEPICLEISCKDANYAQALEAVIPKGTMTTFVTQCKEDYALLTDEMIERRKLRINVVMFSHRTLDSWRPELSRDEIQRWGFDGFLLDYLDGPPPVLSALCQMSRIHTIPVSLQELRNNAEIEREERVRSYISRHISYQVRRAYGSTSVKAMRIREPKFLKQSVDMERKRQLELELEQLLGKMDDCAKRLKVLNIEENKLRARDQRVREEKASLTNRKKEIGQQKTKYQRMKQDLGIKSMQLANLEREGASTAEEEMDIKNAMKAVNVKRAKLALDFKNIQRQTVDIFYQRTIATLQQIELQAKINERENHLRESDQEVATAHANLQTAQETSVILKHKAKRQLEEAKATVAHYSDEEKAQFQGMYADKSLEELEDILNEQKARAEMINQTDAGVIDDYERRNAEIERIRKKLNTSEGRLTDWRAKMQRIKHKWLPELSQLVGRISTSFSTAFDKIGCAGEVKLSQHEDYDKWSIDILVKFRDNEKLHLLTGQRQSGGERSVSTILYLMALQELSNTPFRVVDEINQGMDPRNERMVHGEMVRAACQEGTSQYFLITPKLLPDLEYHERMRVLCVFNGPYTCETIDAKQYIARRLARIRRRQ